MDGCCFVVAVVLFGPSSLLLPPRIERFTPPFFAFGSFLTTAAVDSFFIFLGILASFFLVGTTAEPSSFVLAAFVLLLAAPPFFFFAATFSSSSSQSLVAALFLPLSVLFSCLTAAALREEERRVGFSSPLSSSSALTFVLAARLLPLRTFVFFFGIAVSFSLSALAAMLPC